MKKNKLVILAACSLIAGGMKAQTLYEGSRLMGSDLNGTARFVGMGGAMGALGGDISTISTNPAGIGIYRSNDFMMSFGFNNTGAESTFGNSTMNANRFKGSFDNIGFVYSNKVGNKTALKFVNFGFNYHKKKNFNQGFAMSGNLNGLSQTGQMAFMTDGLNYKDVDVIRDNNNINFYTNPDWSDVGWLTIMGVRGGLIDNKPVLDSNGNQEVDENGDPLFYTDRYVGIPGKYGQYNSTQSGGINQYDFNMSFNIQDRVYLGFTLGAYDVNYSMNSFYSEQLQGGGSYSLENWFRTDGAGVDFKVGAIIRPVLSWPLRIGLAVHTPTWYNLRDTHSARLTSNLGNGAPKVEDTYENAGEALREYQVVTPWKFNLSLGYTIGSSVALGAEYEYEDHSSVRFHDVDGISIEDLNQNAKNFLRGVHTMRLGVEAKLVPSFSVRAGYNFSTAAFNDNAYKALSNSSTRTDTQFTNTKAKNNVALGMGYRGNLFYADLAYQYSMYKSDFYPFYNTELAATKVNNDRHQLLLTLGVRF